VLYVCDFDAALPLLYVCDFDATLVVAMLASSTIAIVMCSPVGARRVGVP